MHRLRTAIPRPPGRRRPYPRNGRLRRSWGAALSGAALGLALALASLAGATARAETADRPVFVIDINGAIGGATAEFILRALGRAREADAPLVVLRIDTPGGLVSSTREIVGAILSSPVPIAAYVAPQGARAASAGTYIMYAAHVAAMAPGTHLGAATPITIGGSDPGAKGSDGFTAAERKYVNDAVAWIRSLAQLRGRNADWAERAVRAAATLTAQEAEKEHVIDLVAADIPDLLARLDGRRVSVAGAERRLATKGAPIAAVAPGWRDKLLAAIGDPTVAYLLLLAGIYGLLFELWHPGVVAPGVAGAISLVLALTALSVMPVDYAGLGLLALGVALMAGEPFTGIGALGVGGLAAFAAGSLLLFDPEAARGIAYRVAWPVVAAATAASGLFLVFGLGLALRARRRPLHSGPERLPGSAGDVLAWSGEDGTVRVGGEVWTARSDAPLKPGDTVRVRARRGLTLLVEPKSGK